MAGTFMPGENKVRPGSYFNIQKKGKDETIPTMDGVTAVIFKSDFGPLNQVVELGVEEGYENVFGDALTTDALNQAFLGGARKIIGCRVGNGGTAGTIALKEKGGASATAVTITARYPGAKPFTVSIRSKLTDSTKKECIFYTGTKEFEKVEFASGAGETKALVEALLNSKNFKAGVESGKDTAELALITQSAFTPGTNPNVTNEDYANAFSQVEPFEFNTICVDTEDTAVHLLLQSFVNRIFDAASLTMAVVAEKHTVDIATRKAHAVAFDDYKMHYILNAHVNEKEKEIDGYQTAARIAGMIGAASSKASLTHEVIKGFTEIKENLTNTEIADAEKKGCIVLTYNKAKQVQIDSGINTLVSTTNSEDDGWKKIRRVKTRFELIRRINNKTDELVGKVDNDQNGIGTIISQIQNVGDAMIEEDKLVYFSVRESTANPSNADSAWFETEVIDKDSAERIYMTFLFQFSTRKE